MQLEIKKYLFDIQTSIDSINDYLGHKRDFHTYKANKLLRRGIERELEIIGKCAGKLQARQNLPKSILKHENKFYN